MWINRQFFDMLTVDNKTQQDEIVALSRQVAGTQTLLIETRAQKAKDDLSIDWLRHRVNALEKQNAVLLMKAAGVAMPVPEIVPTRMTDTANFDTMPSFEDVGDTEAVRLGVSHDDAGTLIYDR